MDYQAYLRSAKWKRLRRAVLKRDGWRCRSCGERATEVHHQDYERRTMQGAQIDRLFAVCRSCHEAVSFDLFGFKRPRREQREWTEALKQPTTKRAKHRRPKAKKHRLSLTEIRVRSQEYAEGRIR